MCRQYFIWLKLLETGKSKRRMRIGDCKGLHLGIPQFTLSG